MDNLDFSDYEEIIKSNFYSDDFAHMLDLDAPDINGNKASYSPMPMSDEYFDSPSEVETDDFF